MIMHVKNVMNAAYPGFEVPDVVPSDAVTVVNRISFEILNAPW